MYFVLGSRSLQNLSRLFFILGAAFIKLSRIKSTYSKSTSPEQQRSRKVLYYSYPLKYRHYRRISSCTKNYACFFTASIAFRKDANSFAIKASVAS